MGHADGCWCSRSARKEDQAAASPATGFTERIGAQKIAEDDVATLQLSSSDTASGAARALLKTTDDTDSYFSFEDAILVAPSDSTESDFEELDITDGQPVQSDNEDWFAVSPGLRAHRPDSLLSSRTTSDASVQASIALPSPSQAHLTLAYQARVSDAGSETG